MANSPQDQPATSSSSPASMPSSSGQPSRSTSAPPASPRPALPPSSSKTETPSSFALVAEANDLLDSIAASGFRPENFNRLLDLRDRMLRAGFQTPLIGLLKQMRLDADMEENELQDQQKQIQQIRYWASLKKYTLARTQIALASHAIGQQPAYAGLLPCLPLSGNYINLLAAAGSDSIFVYRELSDAFVSHQSPYQQALVSVEYEEEGKPKSAELKISSEQNVELKVRRIYGESAKVKDVRLLPAEAPLLRSRSMRIALCAAASALAAEQAKAALLAEEEKHPELRRYNDLLRRQGLLPDIRMDLVQGNEELKQVFAKAGFLRPDGLLPANLAGLIDQRKLRRRQLISRRAAAFLFRPLFEFYLFCHSSERKEDNLLASLAPEPSAAQLQVFDLLKLEGQPQFSATLLLREKFEAEELRLSLPGRTFGAAFYCWKTGTPAKEVAAKFSVPEAELASAKEQIASLLSEGRGKEFLEKLKQAKPPEPKAKVSKGNKS